MERSRIGGPDPADLADLLGATEVITVDDDPLDDEYLTLLWAHPGFQRARRQLRQEFDELGENGIFIDTSDVEIARKNRAAAAYPLREFAETWGVSPAAAYTLARTVNFDYGPTKEDTEFARFRRESNALIVWEDEAGCTIYIPKPLTPSRVSAMTDWLKGKREPGRLEKNWSLDGKTRWQTSRADVEALPWFRRWNDENEDPMVIWRDVLAQRPELNDETFVEQLARLWKRMRAISEDGIRPDRPSKKRA